MQTQIFRDNSDKYTRFMSSLAHAHAKLAEKCKPKMVFSDLVVPVQYTNHVIKTVFEKSEYICTVFLLPFSSGRGW